ncbi:MAG: NAD(P)/FAD-dependent oxidoreductase, partial [Armatimonadetes bacterium]|nr:NAD(P)/FAD-dependent oxidoreductase [Armatimonadota bacterium]
TVTLIGQNPGRQDMDAFLESPAVRKHFPRGWSRPSRYCSCVPQLPITAARNPVCDRLVVIGDAHTSRYLKNGIESSFYTAMWAAKAIASNQTLAVGLRKHYLELCRRTYVRDNAFGRMLLRTHDIISRSAVIARVHMAVAREEQVTRGGSKLLTQVLWATFTGSMPYRKILGKALDPRLQLHLAKALLSSALGRRKRKQQMPRLEVPRVFVRERGRGTVVVIGGGPAGTACAITLARGGGNGVPSPNVVLLEDKQFGERQNQCAGVLSPPGPELIAELLGEPVPESLLQRRIRGYALHGAGSSIYLDGEEFGESPRVLRRVELDRLLLERSRESGVRVFQTRATDVELMPDRVVVHTESGSVSGDGVVGAFALDDSMARAFSRSTRYRRPLALETLACKIHPGGLDFVEGLLDDCIHVYLPRRASIDFGALIPKGNHIVIIIAGARVGVEDMDGFMALPEVRRLLPEGAPVQGYYKGAFPLGPARGLHGESYVVIGDAAGMVRPFKGKGINSALDGGRKCAEAILAHGFSREGLAAFVRSQRHLTGDVWYGRFVRRLVMLTSKRGLVDPIIEQARENGAMSRALFDCISGRTTYREVVLRAENLQWIPSAAWRCATWRGLEQVSSGNDKGELQ